MPAPLNSKSVNQVTSQDGSITTIKVKGVNTDEFYINPQTGSTAGPSQRIDFSYNFESKSGRMLKDAYILYKVQRGATGTGDLRSRHPLVEMISEIRLSINNNTIRKIHSKEKPYIAPSLIYSFVDL